MSVLHGPTEAGNFRVKQGRYGDRWYTDPLPGCERAPASDWRGPSFSITKPPFANRFVAMRTIADFPSEEWTRLAALDPDARYEAIKAAEKIAGRVNMDRGSIVHERAEDRLRARAQLFAEPNRWNPKALEQAQRFFPALDQFFDDYQPELVAAEVVCIHRDLNGVGYGMTADALVKIEGELCAIDYKSRNSDHAAYMEEAAQGGACVGAQYMIVADDDGTPVRAPIPNIDRVLIVSIREDGYRVYPIDPDGATTAYHEMHRWWCAQRRIEDDRVIDLPWGPKRPPAPKPTPPGVDRRDTLRGRFGLLDDDAKAEFKSRNIDPNDLDAIEAAINDLDPFSERNTAAARAEAVLPKVIPEPTATVVQEVTPPDEGGDGDVAAFRILEAKFTNLAETARAWIGGIARQAQESGAPFGAGTVKTIRRFEIYRGLLALAEHGFDEDELLRDVLATALASDDPFMASITLGHAVGAMSAAEATTFARVCVALCDDAASVDIRQRPAA